MSLLSKNTFTTRSVKEKSSLQKLIPEGDSKGDVAKYFWLLAIYFGDFIDFNHLILTLSTKPDGLLGAAKESYWLRIVILQTC